MRVGKWGILHHWALGKINSMGSWCKKPSDYMGGWCRRKLNSMGVWVGTFFYPTTHGIQFPPPPPLPPFIASKGLQRGYSQILYQF